MTRYRWFILALLFLLTTNNYLDRIVFSVLIPVVRDDLHISTEQYAWVTATFKGAYTIGFLFAGKFIDTYGTRLGYSISIVFWSLAAVLHATARNALQLSCWRGMLGVGESGNFPAAVKAVGEWFPKKDRGLATGIFNSGPTLASIIGPPMFVWLSAAFGWRTCFLLTGASGFVLVVIWWLTARPPEKHPSVGPQELAYIRSDADEQDAPASRVGMLTVLKYKEAWGFALGKCLADPVWWFYLEWLPLYLVAVRGFNMQGVGWAVPAVYVTAGVGSIAGGWLTGKFLRLGWGHAKARKTAMAICVSLMPLGALAVVAPNPVLMIALIGIATGAHQGWSGILFTTTTDMFPKHAVASVNGFGGALGGLGGVLFSSFLPGWIVPRFGYTPIFMIMGCLHIIGLLTFHLLAGKMRRVAI
jgi:ACS family hexuronate transporter-like MFS transporter